MLGKTIQVVILVGGLLASICGAADRPNIVLIMADDLGYEGLSCNGGTSFSTPSFDQLARAGMRFTHCYSQPICTPSRNKIMTGRSNARNYIEFGTMARDEVTFGTMMKQAGYRTAIAGKWQLAGRGGVFQLGPNNDGSTPRLCGFDQSCMWAYQQDLTDQERASYFAKLPTFARKRTSRYWCPAILENEVYRPTTIDDYGPDLFTDFLIDFMEANRDQPFFVYYPMALTHNPFLPTPDANELSKHAKFRSDRKHFGPMIEYTGKIVQRILDQIERLGLSENTLVIFTADNGTHRSIVSRTADRVIIGGKGLLIDAGVHVPMLAWWQGKVAPGSVCHDLIEFSDFFPTIAAATGATMPTDRPIDGHSFLPRLMNQPYTPRPSVFVHYDKNPTSEMPQFRRVRAAFDRRFKLYLDGRLFDVIEDPEELHPLVDDSLSDDARDAKASLSEVLASMPAWSPDNSTFGDQPDGPTRLRHGQLAKLLGDQGD